MRVLHNGRLLAGMESANLSVGELFCMLHDTQRRNERRDPSHGRRAARYAKSLRGVWFDLSDKEMELLTEALKYHSDRYTEADIIVQVCLACRSARLGPCGHQACPSQALYGVCEVGGYIGGGFMRGRWRTTARRRRGGR